MSDETMTLTELVEKIGDQRFAMVTTIDGDALVSRPMGMQTPDADGTLWFFTKPDTDKAEQVAADPRVNVAFTEGDYLSVSGTAQIVRDVEKNKELWDASVQAWMQGSPTDPDVALLKVTPQTIAYWVSGSRVTTMASVVKGLVSGERPQVGEHGVVEA